MWLKGMWYQLPTHSAVGTSVQQLETSGTVGRQQEWPDAITPKDEQPHIVPITLITHFWEMAEGTRLILYINRIQKSVSS